MNKKTKIEIYALVILLPFLSSSIAYQFKHPEKTQTQLFIDLINGKMFREMLKWSK